MRKLFRQAGRASLLMGLGLLAGCGEADAPDDALTAIHAPEIARIEAAEVVLDGAHIPTLDPGTMNDAEIRKAIGPGPRCAFRYTSTGRPVLAVDLPPDGATRRGVVKLNGSLVILTVAPTELASAEGAAGPADVLAADVLALAAEPIRTTLWPFPRGLTETRGGLRSLEATMVFEVGDSLRAGYRGYLDCVVPEPPPG